MASSGLVRIMVCLLLVALLGSACEANPQVIKQLDPLSGGVEPTSVVVHERTPVPTPTQTVTPLPTPTESNDPDFYFGGLMITLDNVGQIVKLRRGHDFLLVLGEGYTWEVKIEPERLVTRNMKITPEPGEQGVYVARETGEAKLTAIGTPGCRTADPPCARPDLLFHFFIVIE